MKNLLRITAYIVSIIILFILILLFPPFTSKVSSFVLGLVFEKPVVILESKLRWNDFYLNAVVDKNQLFTLNANNLIYKDTQATLNFKGNVNLFSKIATVELPFIQADLKAVYNGTSNNLIATANALEGELYLDLDLNKFQYTYDVDSVKIESYLQQNSLSNFASGKISVNGKGIIQDKYYFDFDLNSSQLILEDATVDSPIPVTFKMNGKYNNKNITAQSDINTSEISVSISELKYYLEKNSLDAKYKFSTAEKEPLNLTGKNALFGDIKLKDKDLSVTINSKNMIEEARFSMQEDNISFILNNMPMKMISKIVNQPSLVEVAQADISFDFKTDLSKKPLKWKLLIDSKNINLNQKLSHDLNITRSIQLKMEVKNNNNKIIIRPLIYSNIAILDSSVIKYYIDTNNIDIDVNLNKLQLPYYTTSKLNFNAKIDLNSSSALQSSIKTDFEDINFNKLTWANEKIIAKFDYVLKRLDRFAKLNSKYNMSGSTDIDYKNNILKVHTDSDQFGKISLSKDGDNIKIHSKDLHVKELFTLISKPIMFTGSINSTIVHTPSVTKINFDSKQIKPVELNSTIRPFSLQSATVLSQKDNQYVGYSNIKTSNETLILKNININMDKLNLLLDYDLNILKLENATLSLPKELNGTVRFKGKIEHDKIEKFSLSTSNFTLPQKWHHYLDKNATKPLIPSISIETEYYDNGKIKILSNINSDLISIQKLNSEIDLNSEKFKIKSEILTDLWLKDMNISLQGSYDKDSHIYLKNSTINTSAQELKLDYFRYRSPDDISASYELKLSKSDDTYLNYHEDAILEGKFQTLPKLEVTLKSRSFDGTVDIKLDQEYLNIQTHKLSIPLLLSFLGKKTPLELGTLDSYIKLSTQALIENNLTKLNGVTVIKATDLLIHGVILDNYLVDLKDSQNLSVFNKNFTDLPIIRSFKNVSENMLEDQVNVTKIKNMHLNTVIKDGIVLCEDCALATYKNRIAFQGALNLNTHKFQDLYVGLLNEDGCLYFIQKIEGDMYNPKVKLASAGFDVLTGSVISLASNITDATTFGTNVIKKTGDFLGNVTSYIPIIGNTTDATLRTITDSPSNVHKKIISECKPFYTGGVSHPYSK